MSKNLKNVLGLVLMIVGLALLYFLANYALSIIGGALVLGGFYLINNAKTKKIMSYVGLVSLALSLIVDVAMLIQYNGSTVKMFGVSSTISAIISIVVVVGCASVIALKIRGKK